MEHSFDLTPQLVKALNQLDNAYAEAYITLQNSSDEERQALHRYARISMVGASTRIENAQLTDSEVSWLDTILSEDGKTTALDQNRTLIEDKLSKDRERSIEEVAGCRAMLLYIYEQYKDLVPLTEIELRSLHHILMRDYQKALPYAGSYKIQSNSVRAHNNQIGESRIVFLTADAGPITASAMKDLVEWYNEISPLSPWTVVAASEFVYRFLAIHPFQDGNGRMGRGLFLLTLLQSPSNVISTVSRYLAIDRYIEKHKEDYYAVLNRCSEGQYRQNPKEYKIQYFVKFMIKVLLEAVEGIQIAKQKFAAEKKLSEAAQKILTCFKEQPEIRLTTGKIIELTGLRRRGLIYALNTLLEYKMIQRYGQGRAVAYQLIF
ncbi:MAG: Fic family protein [Alphaproteobacteria bacterium]|jgi:Fic family protein|nr:Fic family protein [Alphaproteobacteria bacterium]